ncbi:hypothetical protein E2C01_005714 [Portunus trituberculatus]|uniref:Uncharacterized protein n=1 Tax=Portunus trituberculatus TaxID=210409 RepID=A0A5B7CXC2_PORTR|nr:hypothetical protein [Portunus trituberculatus]
MTVFSATQFMSTLLSDEISNECTCSYQQVTPPVPKHSPRRHRTTHQHPRRPDTLHPYPTQPSPAPPGPNPQTHPGTGQDGRRDKK